MRKDADNRLRPDLSGLLDNRDRWLRRGFRALTEHGKTRDDAIEILADQFCLRRERIRTIIHSHTTAKADE